MRCTNKNYKIKLLCVLCIAALFMTGCSFQKTEIENPYTLYSDSSSSISNQFFAQNLCVTDNIDYGTDKVSSNLAEGAGVFNLDTKEVLYSQNLFGKLYPASTTKILTAYIIIKHCDLNDMVTISSDAVANMAGSSVCGINAGDQISVKDLLYGLMLVSGNDAANALAEYYSGSVEEFARVMNEEALALGATNSHFVNANGLPDDEHYTTVYDMYLIFSNAIKNDTFVSIIGTTSYDVTYTDASGEAVTHTWENTNQYLTGNATTPDGFQIVGGKTGTTGEAGYCLVLYSYNPSGQPIISIVFKADGKSNLYLLMNEMLQGFAI